MKKCETGVELNIRNANKREITEEELLKLIYCPYHMSIIRMSKGEVKKMYPPKPLKEI